MTNPLVKVFRSKINIAVILLIALLFIGVIGFKIMTNYSWVEANSVALIRLN